MLEREGKLHKLTIASNRTMCVCVCVALNTAPNRPVPFRDTAHEMNRLWQRKRERDACVKGN